MAFIPGLRRLLVEDFSDQADWIGRLIQPLNEFMENHTNALTGQLTFQNNILCQIKTIEVSTISQPQVFKYTLGTKPIGLLKLSIVEISGNPAPITNAVDIDWEYTGTAIKLNNVTGLTAGKRYNLSVIVLGG